MVEYKKEKSLYDLLTEKMNRESSRLFTNVYPKIDEISLSKAAKKAIKSDTFLSRIYLNCACVNNSEHYDDQYLLGYLAGLYDKIVIENNFDHKLLFFSLPMFERLLNSKEVGVRNRAYDLFFKLHCAYDIDNFLFDEKINYAKGFDFKAVCGIEHLQAVAKSEFTLKTVLNFLNFANFELTKQVKCRDDWEYVSKITDIYNDLYRYFSFAALDQTVEKFDMIDNKEDAWKVKYSDKELNLNKDNSALVSFYYGQDIPKFINKYFQFKNMENLMLQVTDEVKRKEMLLTSFCYSEYCDNEFFNSFNDVDLTIDDLVLFIRKYEDSGNKFTQKQANLLLKSFESRYFERLGLNVEYNKERSIIKNLYNDYYNDNFAFSDYDFIKYINDIIDGFETIGFDGKQSLDCRALNIIVDNSFVVLPLLRDTNIFKDYFNSTLIDEEMLNKNDEIKENYRINKFNELYPIILDYLTSDCTFNYFLRAHVDEEDHEIAKEIFNWYKQEKGFCDPGQALDRKQNTSLNIRNEFVEAFNEVDFDKQKDVFNIYLEYIFEDNLQDVFCERDLVNLYEKCRTEMYKQVSDDVCSSIEDALQINGNLFLATSKYHFSLNDIRNIFKMNGISTEVYERYKEDRDTYYESIDDNDIPVGKQDGNISGKVFVKTSNS